MKRLLTLLGSALLASCSRDRAHADGDPSGKVLVVAPQLTPEIAPTRPVEATRAASASKPGPAAIRETDAPLPDDLRLRVDKHGDGWALVAERRGHLMSLRQRKERATGVDKASLAVENAEAIVVEATDDKTLETTRVVAHLTKAEGERPTFVAHLAETPIAAGGEQRDAHTCRAHEDGFGGFAVLCRVATEANVGSITGDEASDGVFETILYKNGATTLARLDLDLGDETAISKAIAYNSHGRGVLVRAEVSRAPGEDLPSLVIASAGREQPHVLARSTCCRLLRIDPQL